MSHYFVGVVIPDDLPEESIENYIETVMEPYNENNDVAPYKVFQSDEDNLRMANFYGKQKQISIQKLEDLVPHMKDWTGREGGIEDGRLYHWSTYNPNSKWDWYSIGGRWDGRIQGHPAESMDGGFNFGENHHRLEHNIAKLSDIINDDERRPFAFVTPVGNWVERGTMGWWGIVTDEAQPEDWEKQVKAITDAYGHCKVVGLDCHI